MDYRNMNVMDVLEQINSPRLSNDLARVLVEINLQQSQSKRKPNFANLHVHPVQGSDAIAVFDHTNEIAYYMDNDYAWPILLDLMNDLSELEKVMYGIEP